MTEGTPYACQFCDKAFPRLSYLKKHEQVMWNFQWCGSAIHNRVIILSDQCHLSLSTTVPLPVWSSHWDKKDNGGIKECPVFSSREAGRSSAWPFLHTHKDQLMALGCLVSFPLPSPSPPRPSPWFDNHSGLRHSFCGGSEVVFSFIAILESFIRISQGKHILRSNSIMIFGKIIA